ncbi:MAG: DUF58 domain-containing protein, partial [Bacteroidota bacterium]
MLMTFFRSLYLDKRFFFTLGGVVLLFVVGYIMPGLLFFAKISVVVVVVLLAVDLMLLYRGSGLRASREAPERFSNGDDNEIQAHLESGYGFAARVSVVDE